MRVSKINGDSIGCFKVDVTLITNTYNIRRATKFLNKVLSFSHRGWSQRVVEEAGKEEEEEGGSHRRYSILNTYYQTNSLIKLPMKYSLVLKSGYGG